MAKWVTIHIREESWPEDQAGKWYDGPAPDFAWQENNGVVTVKLGPGRPAAVARGSVGEVIGNAFTRAASARNAQAGAPAAQPAAASPAAAQAAAPEPTPDA